MAFLLLGAGLGGAEAGADEVEVEGGGSFIVEDEPADLGAGRLRKDDDGGVGLVGAAAMGAGAVG